MDDGIVDTLVSAVYGVDRLEPPAALPSEASALYGAETVSSLADGGSDAGS